MFRLAYTFYYKLVRTSKDKDPGPINSLKENDHYLSALGGGW